MKVKKEVLICPKCNNEYENLAVMSYNSGIKPMAESAQSIVKNRITKCEKCGVDLIPEIEWYILLAKHGNPLAQVNLANRLAKGQGIEKDPEKAKYWLDKAKKIKELLDREFN